MFALSDDERDMITELMNVGVGHAAAAFSMMIGSEVRLTVPSVELLSRPAASGRLRGAVDDRIVGIQQRFDGPLTGVAALIFPEKRSLDIIRAVLPAEAGPVEEIGELERETFLEIGNIILNNCLATISNILGAPSAASLPLPIFNGLETIFQPTDDGNNDAQPFVLFLQISFSVRDSDIRGYLIFVLDMLGADRFLAIVRAHIRKLSGG